MADTFEVIYKNRHSGVEERCTASEWERIKAHKTLGRAFVRVRIEKLPQAAIEAQEAKEHEAKAPTPKPEAKPAAKTRSRSKNKSTEEE